jgi:hypothetical protein
LSSAEVVVASTALYMVLNAFFYWTVVKTTVLSQRIMARECSSWYASRMPKRGCHSFTPGFSFC